eukprot:XP_001692217.1 bromodomain protein [Chlamydomonas reinhardtii]
MFWSIQQAASAWAPASCSIPCRETIVKQDKDGLFAKPVTDELAPGYSEVIKDPIDLSLIRQRLAEGCYDTWGSLEADLLKMTNNAKTYNPEGSNAWWHADLMEKMSLKYISCGRQGMQNYRGVAASVWRDLRKPAGDGATAIPLQPRYTSAGPRFDKFGNERDPAELKRQRAAEAAEAASLMLELYAATPAYPSCDVPASLYASSLARFISKCGKAPGVPLAAAPAPPSAYAPMQPGLAAVAPQAVAQPPAAAAAGAGGGGAMTPGAMQAAAQLQAMYP